MEEERIRQQGNINNRKDNRIFRASKITKQLLYNMPSDHIGLLMYFKTVDGIFDENEIDQDLRISLLTPFMTEKARRMLSSLPPSDRDSYEHWKQALLREYKITPKLCRQGFLEAFRSKFESNTQFAVRLKNLFNCYLESRKVTTFEGLYELCLADRFRDALTFKEKCFIADKEGSDEWFKIDKIAADIDHYESERGRDMSNAKFINYNKKSYYPVNRGTRNFMRCTKCNGFNH